MVDEANPHSTKGQRIAELVSQIQQAERELSELAPGHMGSALSGVLSSGAVVMHENVTERKRAEAERSRVFNLSLDLLCVGSFDGKLKQVNPAWTQCLGWSAEELTSRPWLDFVHPEDRAATIQMGERIIAGIEARDFENRYICKDGSYRWLSWNSHSLLESRQMFGVARDVTERRENEQQLRLLETCVSRLNDLVLITEIEPIDDPGPRILYVNEAFTRLTGYSAEEAIGQTPRILQGPNTQRATLDRIREGLMTRKSMREELINYTKSGDEYWIEIDLVPVANDKGLSTHFIAIERDITERKRAEAALAESQRQYRDLVETSLSVIWAVDLEGRFTFINQASRTVFGRDPEEMIGHPFHEFVPEDQHQANDEILATMLRDGEDTVDYTNRIRRKDGSIAILNSNARVVRDAQGQMIGISGMSQDTTEVVLAQEAILKSEERFRGLFDQAAVGMCIASTEGIFLRTNERFCEIVGYSAEELLQRDCVETTYPDDREMDAVAVSRMLAGEIQSSVWEKRYLHKDGHPVWCNLTLSLLPDGEGQQQFVGIIQDISEQKAAQEEIRELGGRLVNTLETITDAFFTIDPEWRFTYLNTEAEKLLERKRESLLGQNIWDEFPEGVGSTFEQKYQEAFEETRTVTFEEYFAPLSKWFEVRAFPSTEGLAVYFHDVTELRNSREALAASEEEFRNLAEAMPQIVWITQADGWTTYFNQHWMDYTGLTLEESLGHNWNKPFHPEDRQRAWDAWQLATSTVGTYSQECRLRRVDGEYRWWLIRGEPQQDSEGKVLKWFGTCTNIHDLKNAELLVTQANRALKMLSACNEALIHAEAEQVLLEQVCRIAIETGGYRMAWVGYAQEDESQSIQPLAWAGVEEGYLSGIKMSWREDDPLGQGPAGRAIRENQIVLSEDIEADSAFCWVEAARKRGYRGVICLPLSFDGRTFGVLALYTSQVTYAAKEELQLLRELADDLAFGIQSLRARVEKNKLQQAVIAIASGVSSAVDGAFFTSLLQHTIEALGADAGYVAIFETPENSRARTISAIIQSEEVENFDYKLEGTPSGQVALGHSYLIEQSAQERYPEDNFLAEYSIEAFAGTPLFDSQGTVVGAIAVLFKKPIVGEQYIPSTLQIFAARAASELERRKFDKHIREQAALLDAAHDAILAKDLEGRVVYWNKGAERLYGWEAEEVIGRKVRSFLHADLAEAESAYQKLLDHGMWEGELRKFNKNGKTILVQVSWTLVRDSDGRPTSMLAINSDLTEKKKLEAQFLRAQRLESIGTLAGGIAHDLNNVLAPIMMSLELLKDVVEHDEDKELLVSLMSGAKRGADLVKQVLAFSRGVEGQRIPLNVSDLMRDIGKVLRETFPKNIEIECAPPATIWAVLGDPTQIHQVILNLCVNARDAMPDGGKLTLSVENIVLDDTYASMHSDAHSGSYVIFKVEDTGSGIPPELQERIFEPFFTTKELGKGTGLGLATSMGIVKSHDGFINFYSELDKGTQFKVYFPADALNEVSMERSTEQTRLPRGNGELILVVDDEESIRKSVRRILERFGYSVLLAEHGAEAIRIYSKNKNAISVVLTDMAMPVMDGSTLIIALKAVNPKVRVIGSSGLTVNGVNAKAVGADVEYFISKPYTAETLLKSLRAILNSQ